MAYKRGDKWVGFYRDVAGKQHTNGNFHRKRDADLWEQEQKSAIRNDTWVDPGRSRMTVGQWSETWMAGRVHLKPKTLSSGWPRCARNCRRPGPGRPTTCCPRCWTTR